MNAYRRSRTSLLLALSLALICLLGVGPGPAHADTITVDTVTDENDGDCSPGGCSLRDAIKTAGSGDTIIFDSTLSGQTITLTIGQLDVDKDLTIDGAGLDPQVQISGNNAVRVFSIAAGVTVTLLHLDIMNGYAADGGGGGIYNNGTLTVTGCTVSDNEAAGNGGGIQNDNGTLTVDGGSVVSGNEGDYGGGLRNDNGTLTVSHSTITGNTATWGGGLDNYAGTAALDNAAFDGNTATANGGGITTGAPLTVGTCIFTSNSAQSGGGIENHGVNADLIVSNSTFTGNIAAVDGGALFNDAATAEVNGSTFENNEADSEGGGIFNHTTGTMVLTGSTLIGNKASGTNTGWGWGGGIFNYGDLTLHGGTLTGNTAHLHGGGIWNWEGELTIDGATFETNSAGSTGGAIVNNWFGIMTVTDCTFRANSAEAGGGIFNDNDSSAVVNSSTFETNNATAVTGATGGGIENRKGTLTADNCTFSGNTSASAGGGVDNTKGSVMLTNCTLTGNSAAAVGGGIFNGTQGTLNIRDTIVANSPSGGDCASNSAIGQNINNLVRDGSCLAAFSGDPGLEPLADNGGPTETHALLPDSPAIDAGDDTTCLAADQRGATRPADGNASGAAACDIGAFELGGLQCGIQVAGEPADYLFLGNVNLRVTDDGTNLDCLRVTDIPSNHPAATMLLQTGRYWQIRALSDLSTAATPDYMVDLTLPYGAADDDDTVCRYTGSGWDCAATSYVADTSVTRANIGQLSDWTVDSGACEAAAMPEPGISLTGAQRRDVLLSWTDVPANAGGYHVYRSKSPYFTPSAGTLRAIRPAGSTSYTDAGAAGTAGVSYSYIVRGLSNCGAPSDYDRRLGVFNFGLVPGK